MSTKIEDLTPECQEKYHALASALVNARIPFIVVSTLRTLEDQQKEWFKGRDSTGNVIDPSAVVTHCDGIVKKSYHQSGNAFDLTFADDNVNPNWPDATKYYHRWFNLGQIAESVGLTWGGRFKPLDANGLGFDPDHFEI